MAWFQSNYGTTETNLNQTRICICIVNFVEPIVSLVVMLKATKMLYEYYALVDNRFVKIANRTFNIHTIDLVFLGRRIAKRLKQHSIKFLKKKCALISDTKYFHDNRKKKLLKDKQSIAKTTFKEKIALLS